MPGKAVLAFVWADQHSNEHDLEIEMNGLGRTLSALRRPRRMREDMKEPLPMPARLAVGFGWESPGHCPPLFSGSFVTSPQGTLESDLKWVPRLCRKVCLRTDSGLRQS